METVQKVGQLEVRFLLWSISLNCQKVREIGEISINIEEMNILPMLLPSNLHKCSSGVQKSSNYLSSSPGYPKHLSSQPGTGFPIEVSLTFIAQEDILWHLFGSIITVILFY